MGNGKSRFTNIEGYSNITLVVGAIINNNLPSVAKKMGKSFGGLEKKL